MLRPRTMYRLFAIFACLAIIFSLAGGAVAHAMEPIGCADTSLTAGATAAHVDGDADQVPADAEKNYPHHHGGCHGHHVGVPIASDPMQPSVASRSLPFAWDHDRTAGAIADPALRPPQA